MNYRHIYHAGNFADVFKHIVLCALLERFKRKEKGFCYLDTHAGVGVYNLAADAALKTQEAASGIGKLMQVTGWQQYFVSYAQALRTVNGTLDEIKYYPGSPWIAKSIVRPQDRLIFLELHQEDVQKLKCNFGHDRQVAVHHYNGYLGLKAFLPPKEQRGLVLIDPPFEQLDEFQQIYSALTVALKRFPHGCYAVWYPIKDQQRVQQWLSECCKLAPYFDCQFFIKGFAELPQLIGCGMTIINPPWQLATQLKNDLMILARYLVPKGALPPRFVCHGDVV